MSMLINLILFTLLLLLVVGPEVIRYLVKRKINKEKTFQAKIERIVNDYLHNITKENT